MQASVFIATSLDGFIAREDGALDWLPQPDENSGGGDFGYSRFMASVDVIVMGRKTFEKVLTFGPWPYEKPVVVLTSAGVTIPLPTSVSVETMSGEPVDILARLSLRGLRHAYIDGGLTIQRFLAAGLIQKMIVTRVPVLIGRGIPLFGPVPYDMTLRHVSTQSFTNGLVQSEYEIGADRGGS